MSTTINETTRPSRSAISRKSIAAPTAVEPGVVSGIDQDPSVETALLPASPRDEAAAGAVAQELTPAELGTETDASESGTPVWVIGLMTLAGALGIAGAVSFGMRVRRREAR